MFQFICFLLGGSCSAITTLEAVASPLFTTHTAFKLLAQAVVSLLQCLDFIHECNIFIADGVIVKSCVHVDLAKQVQLLVNLTQLLLELQYIIPCMRVQLLKLFLGLLQCIFLIGLPSLIILELDLRL